MRRRIRNTLLQGTNTTFVLILVLFKRVFDPDQCGSVGWASSRKGNVAGSIPAQGTCLGCGPVPGWGHVRGTDRYFSHTLIFLSPSFSLASPLSKVNKIFLKMRIIIYTDPNLTILWGKIGIDKNF